MDGKRHPMKDTRAAFGAASEGREEAATAAERLRLLWLQGLRPALDAFLAGQGPLAPAEVAAVLRVDQRCRWQTGKRVPAETYLRSFPEVAAHAESALDLIYGEFLLRERSGETPRRDDFLARFPAHAGVLALQIELHQAVAAGPPSQENLLSHADRSDDAFPGERTHWDERAGRGMEAEMPVTWLALPDQSGKNSEGTFSSEALTLLPGRAVLPVLAGYEVLAEIGRGGMGVIYQARQLGLNRLVALKMISAGCLAGPAELARFRTEAETVARLRHPNVVQIYEVGQQQGHSYLALEFMDRGNLAAHLARQPLAPRLAADLTETLARAVQAAHDQGVIHRDLKPANVLLATPAGAEPPDGVVGLLGVVKITDFGLAKWLHAEPEAFSSEPRVSATGGHTISGTILGTPGYMAPEQAAGKTRHVGPAADIYSLGAILYHALTGQPPFAGATLLETLEQVRSREPVSPSRWRPGLPRDLVTICLKALAKEPSGRYASAAALADDLRRFQAGLPVRARPVMPWERAWRWCRRNPVVAGLSAGLCLLAVILLAAWSLNALIRAQRDEALANLRRAQLAEAEARRLHQEIQIREHLALAASYRRSRQSGQRFKAVAEIRAAMRLGPSPELEEALRNEACGAFALPDLAFSGPLRPFPAEGYSFDFDEAHTLYARTDRKGVCSIRRVADDRELYSLAGLGKPAAPVLSPDGRFLGVIHFGVEARLWQLGRTSPARLLSLSGVRFLQFHRTRPLVGLADEDGRVVLFDLERRRPIRDFPPDVLTREVVLALHPTEPLVAVSSYFTGHVQIRNWRTGRRVAVLPQAHGPTYLAWDPSGRTLAICYGEDTRIHLYDRATWKVFRTLPSLRGGSLTFNHAGDRLVRATWGTRVQLLDVGTGQRLFETTPLGNLLTRFSPDDRRLAAGLDQGRLGIWDVGDARELRLLSRGEGAPDAVCAAAAVHPDGRLLAAAWSDGFGLWDLESGSELAFIPFRNLPRETMVKQLRFEPSGSLLTSTPLGVLRWPVRASRWRPGHWSIGPPQSLPLPYSDDLAQSRDGRVTVSCCRAVGSTEPFAGGWILHADRPSQPIRLDAGSDIGGVAISPDGRWVVTMTHAVGLAKLWDARDGRLVKQLAPWGVYYAWFTPDGEWLGTNWDGHRLYRVPTWEPGPQARGSGVFAPRGNLTTLGTSTSVVPLLDLNTGRECARLEDPHGGVVWPSCFTPDGTRLIILSQDPVRDIRVWDLRRLRQGLGELHLDWGGPDLPPAVPAPATRQRPSVAVDLGILHHQLTYPHAAEAVLLYTLALTMLPLDPEAHLQRGRAYGRLGKTDLAVADYSMFLALTPADDPRRAEVVYRRASNYKILHHEAAYRADLLTLARLDLRGFPFPVPIAIDFHEVARALMQAPARDGQAAQALVCARKAAALEPGNGSFQYTLGLACYRRARYEEAARVLEGNLKRHARYAGLDRYFLSMSYHRLGDPAQARKYFRQAVRWQAEQEKRLDEPGRQALRAVEVEARKLLGQPRIREQ
jgi:serine/threonine protein kinase/WD40 repeat protein